MKLINITFVLSLFFFSDPLMAQDDQPQTVYSTIYVTKTYDWYVKQYELWEKELAGNKKDPAGWLNFCTAARMAKLYSPDEEKKAYWKEKESTALTSSLKHITGTYEYWLLKSKQAYNIQAVTKDPDQQLKDRKTFFEHSLNAYKIDPARWEVYGHLLSTYIEENNDVKAKEIADRWLASGNLTYSVLAFNYNTLASCSENGILFTQGDMDSFPAWVLQYANNHRKDVTIINIWLAHGSREYRNTVFTQAGIPLMPENPEEKQTIIDHVIANRGQKEIFFTSGFEISNYDSLAESVYNVGVALMYSEQYFDNTSYLVNNFENNYLLDQLKYDIQYERWPEKAKDFNFNYVSGLFHLLDHYVVTGQEKKTAVTKEMILNIVSGTQYEEEISKNLEQY